jgi:hypothetical protein
MKKFIFSELPTECMNKDDERILKSAVEISCNNFLRIHNLDSASFGSIAEVLARSLIRLFNDGSREPALLAEHATSRALKSLRQYH